MKKLALLFLFGFIIQLSNAQDVIIKKNGEDIKVKVIEVGIEEIKYKRFDFQDGPTYVILKNEVLVIRYENGVNDVIGSAPVTPPPVVAEKPVVPEAPKEKTSEKIDYTLGSFNQNGRYISKTKVVSILKGTKDPEILGLLKKSNSSRVTGNILAAAVGIPCMVIGSITTLVGVSSVLQGFNPDAGGIATVGGVMAGTGIMLQFANIGFQGKSKKSIAKAVKIYNTKYADQAKTN